MDVPNKLYLQVGAVGNNMAEYARHCFTRVNDSDIVYRREPRWTRVEDGLPETCSYGLPEELWLAIDRGYGDYISERGWYSCEHDMWAGKDGLPVERFGCKVVAWMLVVEPEPPKLLEVNDG